MSASSVASVHNLSALSTPNATTSSILSAVTTTATTPSHLPESPPDSGSEPPYSPSDMHTIPPLGTLSSYHHTIIQKPEDISISSANIQTVNVSNPAAIDDRNHIGHYHRSTEKIQ